MKLIVKQISIKGFKAIEREKLITLYPHTLVEGDNAVGKTTIGDAICYCLYGCNLEGSNKLDLLINKNAKEMTVSLSVAIDEVEHIITRQRKGNITNLSINGRKVNQDELARMLPPKNVFLAIFNPDYFLSLSESEVRNMISGYLKPVSKDDTLAELSEIEKALLNKHHFMDPQIYLNDLGTEAKQSETDITKAEGALENYRNDLKLAKADHMQEVIFDQSKLDAIENEIMVLHQSERKQTNQLHEQKNAVMVEMAKWQYGQPELKPVPNKADLIGNIEQVTKPDTVDMERMIAEFRATWKLKKEQLDSLANMSNDTVCPSCQQGISSEHIQKLKANLAQALETINQKAQQVKEKDYAKAREAYLQKVQAEEDRAQQMIADAIKENKQIQAAHDKQVSVELSQLQIQMDQIDHQLAQAQTGNIAELEATKSVLLAEKQQTDIHNAKCKNVADQIVNLEASIKRLVEDVADYTAEKQQTEQMISAVKNFILKQVELQADQIKQHLDKADIKLKKMVKTTGEVKDCFEVTYDGKAMLQLSRSEAIRATLEISQLIKALSGYIVPVFADNSESITSSVMPAQGQCIKCCVVKGKPLEIKEVK